MAIRIQNRGTLCPFRDLNHNYITTLESKSLTNMPELITLRLHSQNGGGLKAIRYNAFKDINAKLENLYVYHVAILFNVNWSDTQSALTASVV